MTDADNTPLAWRIVRVTAFVTMAPIFAAIMAILIANG